MKLIQLAINSVKNRQIPVPLDEAECYIPDDGTESFSTWVEYGEDVVSYYENNGGRIGGYDGNVSTQIFPIDIDCGGDASASLKTCVEIYDSLVNVMEVDQEYIMIFYSGSKGFHLYISASLFGISPTLQSELCQRFKWIAKKLHPQIDYSLYKPNMLLRVENTRHSKSGLYKIPITHDEIHSYTIEEIQELAKNPRDVEYDYFHEGTENDTLNVLWLESEEIIQKPSLDTFYAPTTTSDVLKGVTLGQRNQKCYMLGCSWRRRGLNVQQAYRQGESWNTSNSPPLSIEELRRTIKSAYSRADIIETKQDMKQHLREDYVYNTLNSNHKACYIHMITHFNDRDKMALGLPCNKNQWITSVGTFAESVFGINKDGEPKSKQIVKTFIKKMVDAMRIHKEIVYPKGSKVKKRKERCHRLTFML